MLVWAETKVGLGQSITGNLPAVLWDLEEGRRVRLFPGMVTSAAISGDGRRAAIVRKGRRGADARGEQRILIYDLEEPDEDRSLVDLGEFHRVAWLSLDAQGERLAVMGHDGASLFDITATRAVPRMPDTIYDSRITADGKTMVVHDKTREISFVDLRTLKVTRSIPVTKRPESYVMSTDFRDFDMDAEARFAIAKADITTLRWIDLEAGKTLREFDGDGIRSCLLTGGGTRLLRTHGELSKETVDKVMMDFVMTALIGQSDLKPEDFLALVKESAVELVDLESGKTVVIRSWSGVGLPVRSADGMKVLVPSKNENGRRRAYVIDGKTGKQLFKVTAPTVSGVFSPKSDRLLTMDSRQIGGSYASIGRDDPQILDARTGAVVCTLATGGVGIMDARWSPDGGLIAVACRDGVVRVCEPTGGRVMHALRGHTGKVTGCEFSADGELIVSHSEDGTFRVWEVEAEKEILRVAARSTLGERGTWKRARFVDGDQGILVFDEKSRPYLYPVDPVARGRLMGIEPIPESDLERLGL